MGRREYEKQRAKAATYIGLGQLLQGGAAMVNQYYQRERDALKQASLERLQQQEHAYRKERDAKNDEYRQAQLDATKANAESSRAIQQQNADTQKQLAELSATKHADDKALQQEQLVRNELSRFDEQRLRIRESASEYKPGVAEAMEKMVNQNEADFVRGLQQGQPELFAKLGLRLPAPTNTTTADAGNANGNNVTGKSRSELINQHLGGDNGYTQQLAALDKQIAERAPMMSFDDFKLSEQAPSDNHRARAIPSGVPGLSYAPVTHVKPTSEQAYEAYKNEYAAETAKFDEQRQSLLGQEKKNQIQFLANKLRSGQATPDEKLMLQSLLNPAMQNTTAMTMPTPGVR